MLEYKFKKNDVYVKREIENTIFLVRVRSEEGRPNLLVLDNPTQITMWDMLDDSGDIKEIINNMMDKFEFNSREEAGKHAEEFISDLIKKSVLIKC